MTGYREATRVVHLGAPPAVPGGPVSPPVVMSATYHQGGELVYGRDGNPTWLALEEAIGGLEGGTALTFASGMAAIAGLLELLPIPGRVVVAGDAYNGTRRFLTDVAGRGRLRFRTVDVADTAGVLETCGELAAGPGRPSGAADGFGAGGLLWLESPTNPLLAIADLAALCEGAHSVGMDVVVDNTFASPLLQRPLDLGADAVVHSATKILAGHSDVVLGAAVTRRPELVTALARRRSLHGAIPGPWEAWLVLRGLRTLRVRQERAQANAGVLAERLSAHPAVSGVRYPGLASDPGNELARRQMSGFGTMVAFEVGVGGGGAAAAGRGAGGAQSPAAGRGAGGAQSAAAGRGAGGAQSAAAGRGADGAAAAAERVVSRVRLLTAGTSLGGVETLIERRGRWEGEQSLPPGLLRMSVGIEDVEDLWEDLEQALSSS